MLDEFKVRTLVNEIAKDIVPIEDILKTLDMTIEDYIELSRTRPFKEALSTVTAEWQGAINTPKRVRLKAAAITEELMLKLFFVARDSAEGLGTKVKCLEAISKIAGLNTPDTIPAGATGNSFNLQINFSNGEGMHVELGASEVKDYSDSNYDNNNNIGQISHVFVDDPPEEL